MDDYLAPSWRATLAHNRLDSFDALWAVQAEWFEPPNRRRGGWSGVVRLDLQDPDGGTRGVFLKRQENHPRRALWHPISGEPTFAAETRNILALSQAQVPSLQPVYYAQRRVDGVWRAILITEELRRYRPLDVWIDEWRAQGWQRSIRQRRAVVAAAADCVRRLHRQRRVHNALHPKHLFVRLNPDGGADVRLIDLEKMRRARSRTSAMRRDLDSLNRRTLHLSRTDRLRFLMHYFGVRSLAPAVRHHWRHLARRYAKWAASVGLYER